MHSQAHERGGKSFLRLGLLSLGLLLALGLLAMTWSQSQSNEAVLGEIVIGYNADQTSDGTGLAGVSARQGFEIAIDEVNAAGGVLGRKVRGVAYDDKLDKELSKQNVITLINVDHAVAIIGPANSGNALHWINVAQESGTTVISPIATNSGITQKYKDHPRNYIFRIAPTDMNEIRVIVPYLLRKTAHERVAVLYDSTGYGVGGNKDTLDVLSRWGVVPVYSASFDRGASSSTLTALLKRAQDAGAEGIVIYALADSTSDILHALVAMPDYHPVLMGPYANVIPSLWNLAGPLATMMTFGTAAAVSPGYSEDAKALDQKIVAKYGTSTPSFTFAAQGYDATKLILNAITAAGSADKTAIRDALEHTGLLVGAVKTYESPFSKDNHEALSVQDIILAHWRDGVVYKIDDPIVNSLHVR